LDPFIDEPFLDNDLLKKIIAHKIATTLIKNGARLIHRGYIVSLFRRLKKS
jgi:hypothetical protein